MKIALIANLAVTLAVAVVALGLTATTLKAQDELFTDTWGFNHEQTRWDLVRDGKFRSRVFVSSYEGGGNFYFGMMSNTYGPILQVLGASVEFPIPSASFRATFDALKSGKYVMFRYRPESRINSNRFTINTLSLKGSRKAIEALEQSVNASRQPSPQPSQSAGQSDAVRSLMNVLNTNWSFAGGNPQDGKQRFDQGENPCTFQVFIDHPNKAKSRFELNLQKFDANRIT